MLKISSRFDSGNIEVLEASDPGAIRLNIRPDGPGDVAYIWFYFLVTGARGQDCRFEIENAKATRWAPAAFEGYRIVASYDRQNWFRIPTTYDDKAFAWEHRPERDRIYYAYHAPYPTDRRMAALERCAASPRARVEVIGETPDGRDMELVTIGTAGPGKKVCWVLARLHPGETMAEFAAEGILDRMTDMADPVVRVLLEKAVVHVVPNMNPDGSARGNHRCNALGVDLNRAWSDTTPEMSPEVFVVRERMKATGVDFLLDLHGDETEPHVWPVGTAGIPSWSQRQMAQRKAFDAALLRASPDYRPDKPDRNIDPLPGKDPLAMAISWAAETFGCFAIIMELPFLDNADATDPHEGWSPRRSALFGSACLDALAAIVDT